MALGLTRLRYSMLASIPRSNSEGSWLGFVERMGGLSLRNEQPSPRRETFLSRSKRPRLRVATKSLCCSHCSTKRARHRDWDRRSYRAASQPWSVAFTSSNRTSRSISTTSPPFGGCSFAIRSRHSLMPREPAVSRYFRFENEVFGFAFDPPAGPVSRVLLREVLDWRLAQYLTAKRRVDRSDLSAACRAIPVAARSCSCRAAVAKAR